MLQVCNPIIPQSMSELYLMTYRSYMQGHADQQALLNNGVDREMLTEILIEGSH